MKEPPLTVDSITGSAAPVDEAARSTDVPQAYDRLEAVHGTRQIDSVTGQSRMIRERVIVTLCAVLSVLLCTEALARIVVSVGRPPQFGCAQFDVKKELSQAVPVERPTLFFLGSSMTNRAVYADLIDRELKRQGFNISVFNLASTATYPLDELFLLENAIEHGARPALVVFEINPAGVVMAPEYGTEFSPGIRKSYAYSSVLASKDVLLAEPQKFDVLAFMGQQLNRYSYLVRFRAYLKSEFCSIPAMVFNTEAQTRRTPVVRVDEEVSEQGYGPEYRFMGTHQSFNKSKRIRDMGEVYPFLTAIDRNNLKDPALQRVASYCARRKIPLALLWLPQQERYLKAACDSMGLTEVELHDALQHDAEDNRAMFVDMHDEPDQSNFADTAHVNVIGSIKISQRLAATLSSPPLSDLLNPAGGKH